MGKPEVTHDGTQWSNAEEDGISISAYDPAWPRLYAEEARAIRDAIDKEITFEIEHTSFRVDRFKKLCGVISFDLRNIQYLIGMCGADIPAHTLPDHGS